MNERIKMFVNEPTGVPATKLSMDDVWGKHDEKTHEMLSSGMIVARHEDNCPIFEDVVPYKSVTVICSEDQESDVTYWLEYVHGGNSVSKRKDLGKNKIALRSDYQCW